MCQPDWVTGSTDIYSNILLSVSVFLEELSVGVRRLDKAGGLPLKVGLVQSCEGPQRAKGSVRGNSPSLVRSPDTGTVFPCLQTQAAVWALLQTRAHWLLD